MTANELIQTYFHDHNAGVKSGDFSAVVALFADEGEVRFVGIDYGPLNGRESIAGGFRDNPPTDTLVLLQVSADGNTAVAVYAWNSEPDVRAGTMVVTERGGKILELTISATR